MLREALTYTSTCAILSGWNNRLRPPADVSDRLNKPSAMADSVATIAKAFNHLKVEFNIGKEFSFNTAEIAVNADEFSNPRSVAAITMRKMQLYVHLAHPDTVTRTMTALIEIPH